MISEDAQALCKSWLQQYKALRNCFQMVTLKRKGGEGNKQKQKPGP